MYKEVRKHLLQNLWDDYIGTIPNFSKIFKDKKPVLDHLAIIDLPSPHTGMNYLTHIFSKIGYEPKGEGYLPSKQNQFTWVLEEGFEGKEPHKVLPQVVLADFRMEEISPKVRRIIEKYTEFTLPFEFSEFEKLSDKLHKGSEEAAKGISDLIFNYLKTRQWPLPTTKDFHDVKKENELLAWTLLFGRKVNHFGVLINLYDEYKDLEDFNGYVKETNLAQLNDKHGEVKGSAEQGITQSSTIGELIQHELSDGIVEIHDSFLEFVWRYPNKENPTLWSDYYTKFVAENANYVVESLYKKAG